MIQHNQRVQFVTNWDPTVQKVQMVTSQAGNELAVTPGIPMVIPSAGLGAKKVQVVPGSDGTYQRVRIPYLAAWFKFGTGITSSGGLVSQWDDISGNGRHLKQATETNRPTLEADGSITFDGADNYLKCDAFTLNQPETIYLLFKQVTWTNAEYIFDGNATATGRVLQSPTTPSLLPTAPTSMTANANLEVDTYGVLAVVFNSTSSVHQINNTTPVTGDAGTNNMGGFTLGARGAGDAGYGNIQVMEGMILNTAHGDKSRETFISYLAAVGSVSLD